MTGLYARGLLESQQGHVIAIAVGVLFGFWLERAGFGSSRKLTSIFYLRDFAVFQVFFTALATAAVLIFGLEMFGLVTPAEWFVPPTSLWPQVVGGALFGAGFVAGGYCPGTAVAAVGSGRGDALVFLAGAGIGGVALSALQPVWDWQAAQPESPACSLASGIGVPPLVLAVVLLGVALGAGVLLGRFARTAHGEASS